MRTGSWIRVHEDGFLETGSWRRVHEDGVHEEGFMRTGAKEEGGQCPRCQGVRSGSPVRESRG